MSKRGRQERETAPSGVDEVNSLVDEIMGQSGPESEVGAADAHADNSDQYGQATERYQEDDLAEEEAAEDEGGIVDVEAEEAEEAAQADAQNHNSNSFYQGNATQMAETEAYADDEDEDDHDDFDIDAALAGGDMNNNEGSSSSSSSSSTPAKAKAAWSFLSTEEQAAASERATESSAVMEPAPSSPPEEKMRKIALKNAAGRTTRPPSSFIVYSTKRRSELDASLSFKEKAQLISGEYRTLTDEAKAELDAKCALDRTAYEARLATAVEEEMEILRNDPSALMSNATKVSDIKFAEIKHGDGITLPLAKVKRIIKMNPEVKNCGKEASMLITKATELFTAYIGLKGANMCALRGAKTIQEKDFIHLVHTTDMCEFLREDYPRRQGEDGKKAQKAKPKPVVTTTVINDDGEEVQVEVEQDVSVVHSAESRAKAARAEKMAVHAAGSSKLTGFFQAGQGSGKSSTLAQAQAQDEDAGTLCNALSPAKQAKGKAGSRAAKAQSYTQDSQMTLPFQASANTQESE